MTSPLTPHQTSSNPDYWVNGLPGQIVKGLCGLIAVFVALKAASYQPSNPELFVHQDHFFRVLAFAALTVWTAFTIGIARRGHAAIITLVFAIFVEMFLVPARDAGLPGIVSANLGIVLAYCGLELYWLNAKREESDKYLHAKPSKH